MSVLITGEIAAPFLSNHFYMSQASADNEFIEIVKHLLSGVSNLDLAPGLNNNVLAVARGAVPANDPLTYAFDSIPVRPEYIANLSFKQAFYSLLQLTHFVDREQAKVTAIQVIVQLLVAICKQGTISSEFSNKISQGVREDMGLAIKIKAREVADVWTTYGQVINAGNIESVINHFSHNVMGTATRLVVTLNQAKFHSMTMFQTIGRAMLNYPRLSWHVMEKMAPTELVSFRRA